MQMYTEPEWSTPTASAGHFEVFKSGATAQVVPIAAGTKLMRFGRLPDNDIVLDHESVSRGHAIVQFGPGNGAFLYDLGSTHGTFLNKKRIPAQKYVKLNQANDQIQLGGSTRVFVLNLEEEFASKPDEKATPNLRQRVLDFFEENDVDPKCISVSSHDDTVTCTLNYSDFVHVGSQDNPAVSASGANRELALQAFFEASHEFLLRAGLLQPVDRSASDSDSGEDTEGEFFVVDSLRRKRAAGKEEVLSEKDVSRLKIQHEAELNALSLEISEIEEQISQCAVETECDIDAYLREVRREDLKRDLEKRHVAREQAQQNVYKYSHILKLIGGSNDTQSTPVHTTPPVQDVIREERKPDRHRTDAVLPKRHKAVVEEAVSRVDAMKPMHDAEPLDAGDVDEVDMERLKRTYGY